MTHKTIKVYDVSNFAWFDNRAEAYAYFNKLKHFHPRIVIAGKRSRKAETSWATFNDIKTAANYQNKWTGGKSSWVVAY